MRTLQLFIIVTVVVQLGTSSSASAQVPRCSTALNESTAGENIQADTSTPAPADNPRIHASVESRLVENGKAPIKVWVLFEARKGLESQRELTSAVSKLAPMFDPKAIERRRLRRTAPGLFDIRDLPVPQSYVEAVRRTGADVKVVSRWVNGLSAIADRDQIQTIAQLPFVRTVQPVLRTRPILPTEVKRVGSHRSDAQTYGNKSSQAFYGNSEAQLAQINLIALHGLGYTGAGVRVGILDSGFIRTHEAFNQPGHLVNIVAEYDFVRNDGNTAFESGDYPGQSDHGTYILGVLGAYKPDVLVGGAYDASFILCKTEDIGSETPVEEDNYVAGLEFIEQHGGDMATASLGYIDWYTQADLNGATAVTTIAVNTATANGLYCVNAAGNEGHDANPATSHLIAPADAMEVLACGAVTSTGTITSFSSDGPTADGRVKPEVLALGSSTQTVSPSNDHGYASASGTSLSTPLVAGAVACLVQAHPTWTVQQMRRYLMFTAGDYVANHTYDPMFVRGYGIIDALAASAEDCDGNGVADSVDLAQGARDCNHNLMPDACDIANGFSIDENGNGIPDECEIGHPPAPVADATGLDKVRSLSFSVPTSTGATTGETALRVRFVALHHVNPPYTGGVSVAFTLFEGQSQYVGPPTQYVESASGGITFYASQLQCTPHYRDWTTITLLHVAGQAIVPSSSYDVEVLAASCLGNEGACTAVSAPLTIATARWGDIEIPWSQPGGSAQPDASDIGALTNKFKDAVGAPIKARALLAGDARGAIDFAPDLNFLHVSACVDGFKGLPYPYKPGKCTGDSTKACVSDTDCTAQSVAGPCVLCP